MWQNQGHKVEEWRSLELDLIQNERLEVMEMDSLS